MTATLAPEIGEVSFAHEFVKHEVEPAPLPEPVIVDEETVPVEEE